MSIEEVRALVAERQRYDDWLAALEAKRGQTPPRVFERVHGDYLGRRGEVIVRLQSHIGGLAQVSRDLGQRLDDLESRLALHEEELAEGMLRNLVGEYDGERWDNVRREIEARIAALGDERSTLAVEVDDVQTLLASARVEPQPEPAPEAVVETEPVALADSMDVPEEVEEGAAETADWPVESEPVAPLEEAYVAEETAVVMVETIDTAPSSLYEVGTPSAAMLAQDDEDSLLDIDVSGMVDNPVPPTARHEDVLADVAALFDTSSITAVPEPTSLPTAPANAAEFDDALAMFGNSTSEADAEFLKSLEGIEADHDAPPQGNSRVDVSFTAATSSSAPPANDPFDDLAFLRSVTDSGRTADPAPPVTPSAVSASSTIANEPQKTLRCTECGTMNLPTEWYCERCGGELAAF